MTGANTFHGARPGRLPTNVRSAIVTTVIVTPVDVDAEVSRMSGQILVIVGAGGMGVSVARRLGAGRTILVADIDERTLTRVERELAGEGLTHARRRPARAGAMSRSDGGDDQIFHAGRA